VPFLYRWRPVIAVSPTTQEALVGLGIPEEQIRVVYNGAEQPKWLPGAACFEGRRIAYVGRIKRYKRLDRLVRAVADLRREFPDLRLDLVGEGDAKVDIEALIEESGLRYQATVHGFVSDRKKAEILHAATVFATPSMHEGWGLSVIEANSYGCPAVAYNVPGLKAAIRNGETGILAEDDDSFRRALSFLLQDSAARRRYSAAARAWAESFSWVSCAQETLEVLHASGYSQPYRPS
jgi:glycosyltransferase involved in cell wall biosynthesis